MLNLRIISVYITSKKGRIIKNRIIPGSIHPHGCGNDEMIMIGNLCSTWVDNLIKAEHDLSNIQDSTMMQFTRINQEENVIKVYYQTNNHEYCINNEEEKCSSGFNKIYLLPCKHSIC